MKYQTKIVSKETVAEGTIAFHFVKPDGFTFKAGQAMDITLINPPQTDTEGNKRTFSIASSPSEETLMIATRMRDSAFKRSLGDGGAELEIQIEQPTGTMVLHDKVERLALMLVGGIGITPFRSIVKDATERNLPHKIFLFYSNRRPEDAPFLNEMKELAEKNPNFTFIPTMTNIENSLREASGQAKQDWDGETGYITMDMINKYVSNTDNAIYYSAGPLEMVAAMKKLLNTHGISDDDIRLEEFAGY